MTEQRMIVAETAESLHHDLKGRCRKKEKLGKVQVFVIPKPAQMTLPPSQPGFLIFFPNNSTNWRPCIQTHVPVGNSLI